MNEIVSPKWGAASPGSLPTKVSAYQRQRMFACFMETMQPTAQDTVLDAGVTSDRSHTHSNYFEAWYPYKDRITAAGLEDASFLELLYPGVRYAHCDCLDLPFEDGSFDFVHSSAVIEHVGSRQNQIRFLKELWRVSRKGIFVTTPNRWFPIEVHTVIPLLHFLPQNIFRGILKAVGHHFFADESNLNIMSRGDMKAAAAAAGIKKCSVQSAYLLGLPSNLMLVAKKN